MLRRTAVLEAAAALTVSALLTASATALGQYDWVASRARYSDDGVPGPHS
ncbi:MULTISPECIES: hypothetical protein [Streptomyces]|nr:hypothetical protein OG479_06780 [Streptomyces subrutilus]